MKYLATFVACTSVALSESSASSVESSARKIHRAAEQLQGQLKLVGQQRKSVSEWCAHEAQRVNSSILTTKAKIAILQDEVNALQDEHRAMDEQLATKSESTENRSASIATSLLTSKLSTEQARTDVDQVNKQIALLQQAMAAVNKGGDAADWLDRLGSAGVMKQSMVSFLQDRDMSPTQKARNAAALDDMKHSLPSLLSKQAQLQQTILQSEADGSRMEREQSDLSEESENTLLEDTKSADSFAERVVLREGDLMAQQRILDADLQLQASLADYCAATDADLGGTSYWMISALGKAIDAVQAIQSEEVAHQLPVHKSETEVAKSTSRSNLMKTFNSVHQALPTKESDIEVPKHTVIKGDQQVFSVHVDMKVVTPAPTAQAAPESPSTLDMSRPAAPAVEHSAAAPAAKPAAVAKAPTTLDEHKVAAAPEAATTLDVHKVEAVLAPHVAPTTLDMHKVVPATEAPKAPTTLDMHKVPADKAPAVAAPKIPELDALKAPTTLDMHKAPAQTDAPAAPVAPTVVDMHKAPAAVHTPVDAATTPTTLDAHKVADEPAAPQPHSSDAASTEEVIGGPATVPAAVDPGRKVVDEAEEEIREANAAVAQAKAQVEAAKLTAAPKPAEAPKHAEAPVVRETPKVAETAAAPKATVAPAVHEEAHVAPAHTEAPAAQVAHAQAPAAPVAHTEAPAPVEAPVNSIARSYEDILDQDDNKPELPLAPAATPKAAEAPRAEPAVHAAPVTQAPPAAPVTQAPAAAAAVHAAPVTQAPPAAAAKPAAPVEVSKPAPAAHPAPAQEPAKPQAAPARAAAPPAIPGGLDIAAEEAKLADLDSLDVPPPAKAAPAPVPVVAAKNLKEAKAQAVTKLHEAIKDLKDFKKASPPAPKPKKVLVQSQDDDDDDDDFDAKFTALKAQILGGRRTALIQVERSSSVSSRTSMALRQRMRSHQRLVSRIHSRLRSFTSVFSVVNEFNTVGQSTLNDLQSAVASAATEDDLKKLAVEANNMLADERDKQKAFEHEVACERKVEAAEADFKRRQNTTQLLMTQIQEMESALGNVTGDAAQASQAAADVEAAWKAANHTWASLVTVDDASGAPFRDYLQDLVDELSPSERAVGANQIDDATNAMQQAHKATAAAHKRRAALFAQQQKRMAAALAAYQRAAADGELEIQRYHAEISTRQADLDQQNEVLRQVEVSLRTTLEDECVDVRPKDQRLIHDQESMMKGSAHSDSVKFLEQIVGNINSKQLEIMTAKTASSTTVAPAPTPTTSVWIPFVSDTTLPAAHAAADPKPAAEDPAPDAAAPQPAAPAAAAKSPKKQKAASKVAFSQSEESDDDFWAGAPTFPPQVDDRVVTSYLNQPSDDGKDSSAPSAPAAVPATQSVNKWKEWLTGDDDAPQPKKHRSGQSFQQIGAQSGSHLEDQDMAAHQSRVREAERQAERQAAQEARESTDQDDSMTWEQDFAHWQQEKQHQEKADLEMSQELAQETDAGQSGGQGQDKVEMFFKRLRGASDAESSS